MIELRREHPLGTYQGPHCGMGFNEEKLVAAIVEKDEPDVELDQVEAFLVDVARMDDESRQRAHEELRRAADMYNLLYAYTTGIV